MPEACTHWGLRPILFHYGSTPIPSYSVFMLLALIAGVAWYFKATSRESDDRSIVIVVSAALIGGTLGAKLPTLLFNLKFLLQHLDNPWLLGSGKTIVGGLIGGTVAVMIAKAVFGIKPRLGNAIAPAAALAMAIGRIGCLLNGCCFGRPTNLPWGIDLGDGIHRHPTQIYELIFDLILFAFLAMMQNRVKKRGRLFSILLLTYATFRFVNEFFRTEPVIWLGFTGYQWACVAIFLWGIKRELWRSQSSHIRTARMSSNIKSD